MRARLGGETVADSRRAKLPHRSGALPVLLFPEEDVRLDLVPEKAVRRHDGGLVELDWQAMDEWLEEDEAPSATCATPSTASTCGPARAACG